MHFSFSLVFYKVGLWPAITRFSEEETVTWRLSDSTWQGQKSKHRTVRRTRAVLFSIWDTHLWSLLSYRPSLPRAHWTYALYPCSLGLRLLEALKAHPGISDQYAYLYKLYKRHLMLSVRFEHRPRRWYFYNCEPWALNSLAGDRDHTADKHGGRFSTVSNSRHFQDTTSAVS